MDKIKDYSIIAIIGVVIIILFLMTASKKNKETVMVYQEVTPAGAVVQASTENGATNPAVQEEAEAEPPAVSEEPQASEPAMYRIYITGQINQPGVYDIPEGRRIIDLVEMAGGPAEDANLEAVNLAAFVEDAKHVVIPKQGEPTDYVPGEESEVQAGEPVAADEGADSAALPAPQGPVNINTDGLSRLMSLPGVGQVIGQNIIDYRNQNGPFTAKEQIKNVSRIGDSLYGQIEHLITIE